MDGTTTARKNYDCEHVGLPWFRVSSPLCRPPGLEDDEPSRLLSPVPIGLGTTATLTIHRLQGELICSHVGFNMSSAVQHLGSYDRIMLEKFDDDDDDYYYY